MGEHFAGWFSWARVLAAALFLITLQCSWALSPTNCNAAEPEAERALDLINKGRRNGYLFQLLRVADAHLDRVGPATVYYLVLDMQESDCWVLSRTHGDDCELPASRRPSEMVIGQCKVIATRYSNESQDLTVNGFNCTTSSVSSALSNTKDSPILFDFFEDSEPYRKQADKALDKYQAENGAFASFRVDRVERVIRARGGQGTNYYVDFSVRNCSAYHFPRDPNVFGFCRADLYYDIEPSDLEIPKDIVVNCEVFNLEEYRNISGMPPHRGHPHHFGGREHALPSKHPFNSNGSRDHHHSHKSHKVACPSALGEKNYSDRPPLPPPGPRCHYPPSGTNRSGPPHSFSKHDPHGHPPPGHGPHGHCPPGHRPHGHHPHGHPPGGHPPHGHPPHGHPPHGHPPHGHDFHDYGPCDPPHDQGPKHHHHDHGSSHRHPGQRGPGKRHFPFHRRQIGYVYRLPPLNVGEVLPLPEANFPSVSLPSCNNSQQPEIQPFPQSTPPSESCPGKFKSEFPQLFKFFAYKSPK
ncbi:Histidine-rich glycoprotein [Heterocephalus glaber]|uniref:Histidine-rich glycoprotein n=1 Tax=Heterocephalus glaber TaxID=10181 RepID=G5BT87_HETGA|nr:histidine-rich glycoprotein [Heterocephalus glaber]EHB12509.1 Histidine-rich glycoprotein [Heterocephalus glaber]